MVVSLGAAGQHLKGCRVDEPFPILLVEDQDEHALFTERALKKAGLPNPVIRASDGDEALDILLHRGRHASTTTTPGLVLLDVRMPRVDGIEVLRAIRQSPTLKDIVVVMITTSNDSHDVQECMRLGANSYVTKPVDFHQFQERLQSVGIYWVQTDGYPKPPPR